MSRHAFTDVRRFTSLDSTNRYLVDEARQGAREGVVAVAAHQTAGRGRLGRRWEARPGDSLLVSVLLRPDLAPTDLHLCTALVALAAVDACGAVAGVVPGIKWPNDLVLDDAKVAGVLAEAVDVGAPGPGPHAPSGPAGPADTGPAVVVGIGINRAWAGPEGVGGTSLERAAGRPVDGEALLEALLDALDRWRPSLDGAAGRRSLVAAWRARCVTLGRPVRVELAHETLVGTAVDLSDEGLLVLATGPDGARRTVAAGDVVHLRPSGGGGHPTGGTGTGPSGGGGGPN